MTVKNRNPFVSQLKTLSLQLDNDMVNASDILEHTVKISKADSQHYLAEEATDLIWFRDELASIEASKTADTTTEDVLAMVQETIAKYFQLRLLESLRILGEYDKTQVYLESAILQQNPDYRKSMH
ncbi:hypothetical protein My1_027 [Pectobacterium phage My1]|uniref:Uncharacterized protein n=1 Tax=Pectobacterium phage My1 TaxID=1204539 RepID=J9QPQ8_9CAUD|nr:hypothetical protein My1_027 [Pectobacterium phage My1]AFQ22186.1 hypothetical protein My1_027 [Pectobacterium phage My1]